MKITRGDRPQVIITDTEDDTIQWVSDFHGFATPFHRLKERADEIMTLADSVNEAVDELTRAGYDVVRADLGEVAEFVIEDEEGDEE